MKGKRKLFDDEGDKKKNRRFDAIKPAADQIYLAPAASNAMAYSSPLR